MDGRKVYVNDWLEDLIKQINHNTKIHETIWKDNPEKKESLDRKLRDNSYLLEKLEKYKKIDTEGKVYYYFFPRELEDFFWILLENLSVN